MSSQDNVEPTVKTLFIDDEHGNKLQVCTGDKRIVLYLLLSGNPKKKRLGVITKSTKTMFIKRKRMIHLFRNGNAYGFNEYVLSNAKLFNKIKLTDEQCEWKIPVSFILENGSYLHFKKQGFELQKFVTLSQLEQFKTNPSF